MNHAPLPVLRTPTGRRLLATGDELRFGAVTGPGPAPSATGPLGKKLPEITRRERQVLEALCRPAEAGEAFASPASPAQIAEELEVTEAAVKNHLGHLYTKLGIPRNEEGGRRERRYRLANLALAQGLVRLRLRGGSR